MEEAAAPEQNREDAALKGEPARPLKLLVEADVLKAIEGSLMTESGRPKAGYDTLLPADGVAAPDAVAMSLRPEWALTP